jgi:hypothetical protein
MEDLGKFGIEALKALSPVLLALLSWGALKLSALIHTRVKSEFAADVLSRLDLLAEKAVAEVEQTFVSNLDENAPAESMAKAKDLAMESLKKLLGPAGLANLAVLLGVKPEDASVVAALSNAIEFKVHQLKAAKPASK